MNSPRSAGSDSEEDFHDATSGIASPGLVDSKISRATTPDSIPTLKPAQEVPPQPVPAVEAIEVANDDDDSEELPPPEHPLKSMQGPFEESIFESTLDTQRRVSKRANAEARRQKLLNSPRFDEAWTTRWKQRPQAKYHPLLKLIAQITFGMHLLQQNQAKSDQEVVKILQAHVDEVDNFLERTTEDFELAVRDVEERIQFLQLPMQHMKVFDVMLDDKRFRTQLLDGNDKIEKIIDRTARSMNAALLDVQKGRQATRELGKYLNTVQYTWPTDRADLEAIFLAMRGNEEGWKKCYKDLQTQGNALGDRLIELGTVVGEMSTMAAAASRRNTPQARPRSSGQSSIASPTMLRSRYNIDTQLGYMSTPTKDKPLPKAPTMNGSVDQAHRPASFHQRFDRSRTSSATRSVKREPTIQERPRTSGDQGIRQNDVKLGRRATLALSSHPPEPQRPQSAGNDKKLSSTLAADPARSRSAHSSVEARGRSHARAQSAATPAKSEANASTTASTPKKDIFDKSAFVRRWSIRKKHPGPSPADYPEEPARPVVQPASQTRSQTPRLAPVKEQPGKASLDQMNGDVSQALPAVQTLPPPEPKSRAGSIRFPKGHILRDLAASPGRSDSVHTGNESVSIASSIKRRTLNLKGMFSRRKE